MICTFFGHRDCPPEMEQPLEEAILRLISQGVTTFYVGHQGHFDGMARRVLLRLKEAQPEIHCVTVLAYLNTDVREYGETLYPEGLETVPQRFAVDFRNRFMLNHADFVVTYVKHSFGGAAKYAELARKMEEKGRLSVISLVN